MSKLPEVIRLDSTGEAQRLWRGAVEAREKAPESVIALCEMLDLGLRAAEILAIHRLQAVRHDFPATIASQLELPPEEVDVERDALLSMKALQFVDVLDLLSDDEMDCCSPRLHRGWEDRRFSCARSRENAHRVVSLRLDTATRRGLLTLSAYRNRIFRNPPPLRLVPDEIISAFEDLRRLVDTLSK